MLNEDKKKLFLSWNDDYLTFRRITPTFLFDVVTQTRSERVFPARLMNKNTENVAEPLTDQHTVTTFPTLEGRVELLSCCCVPCFLSQCTQTRHTEVSADGLGLKVGRDGQVSPETKEGTGTLQKKRGTRVHESVSAPQSTNNGSFRNLLS